MVRPLFIPAFWPRPHPFQVQIVPVRDISQLVWLLYVAVTSLKFPRTAMTELHTSKPTRLCLLQLSGRSACFDRMRRRTGTACSRHSRLFERIERRLTTMDTAL